jgi:hypothetical protein
MNQLVPISSPAIPALVADAGARAGIRFLEFFATDIRNPHTRRAYYRAAQEFLTVNRHRSGTPERRHHKALYRL